MVNKHGKDMVIKLDIVNMQRRDMVIKLDRVRACEIETRVRVHPNPSRNVRTRKFPPIYMIANVSKVLCVSGP